MSIANVVKVAGYTVTGAFAGAAVGYFGFKAYMKLSGKAEIQMVKVRQGIEAAMLDIQTVTTACAIELDSFQKTLVEKARIALADVNSSYTKLIYHYSTVTEVHEFVVQKSISVRLHAIGAE